ncbi:MAG: LPXTG cell wall anchor domain-containing protein, partial [Lactobacillaceae bacterium]|nr:LPXTG cell wall anchor domain-containing protein [Lactobacillaceae bacterium]
ATDAAATDAGSKSSSASTSASNSTTTKTPSLSLSADEAKAVAVSLGFPSSADYFQTTGNLSGAPVVKANIAGATVTVARYENGKWVRYQAGSYDFAALLGFKTEGTTVAKLTAEQLSQLLGFDVSDTTITIDNESDPKAWIYTIKNKDGVVLRTWSVSNEMLGGLAGPAPHEFPVDGYVVVLGNVDNQFKVLAYTPNYAKDWQDTSIWTLTTDAAPVLADTSKLTATQLAEVSGQISGVDAANGNYAAANTTASAATLPNTGSAEEGYLTIAGLSVVASLTLLGVARKNKQLGL